jgi:hypothetical protein
MDYSASTSVDDRPRVITMDGERVGRKTLFLQEIGQCLWLDLASIVAMVKDIFLDA